MARLTIELGEFGVLDALGQHFEALAGAGFNHGGKEGGRAIWPSREPPRLMNLSCPT